MKKIRLTENELKRMITNVMEQMNTPSNEGGSNYNLPEYEKILDSHIENIYASINEMINMFHELSDDEMMDPNEKEDLLDQIRGTLDQLGISSREYEQPSDDDEDETIDVDYTDVDDQENL